MGLYVVLSKLTDEGAKTLKLKPERVKEVNHELEKMGVKVLSQYLTLGKFDFVNIVEAEDNTVIARAMIELASRGTVRTMTLPAMPVDEMLEKLK
ncbi:MAG TPA: GYD domain-containing protein [Euryarchaeota archaeon]|nr:GYD domain protein [archaeon BMS3Bbin15]HDL15779.1 GYD domain-containing protein [Euryarchaeota archaeon]